jgi:deazaflavin-dependent oxidoreductase (nitroreductase family)
LFRARLGFLFGNRFVMLEHVGRLSGRPRYVVLEIVDHPSPSRYIVASGFGTRAQWFRNIQADPHVRVTVGSHRPRAAVTHVLTPTDAADALGAYRAAHPRAWTALKHVLTETLGEQVRDDASNVPLVGIDLV